MNNMELYSSKIFDDIKHIDENVMNIGKQENCNIY